MNRQFDIYKFRGITYKNPKGYKYYTSLSMKKGIEKEDYETKIAPNPNPNVKKLVVFYRKKRRTSKPQTSTYAQRLNNLFR